MKEPIPIETPRLLGTEIVLEDGENGMITNETPREVFIESPFFTGWTAKALFYELVGTE